MNIILRISKVKLKNKGGFTLFISGTYPSGHLNCDFEIEYTGADVFIKKGDLLFNQEKIIKDKLISLINYGPFNLKEVEAILIGNKVIFEYKTKYETDN